MIFSRFAAGALGLAALTAATPAQSDSSSFVEEPGVREFTGQMIVKPRPIDPSSIEDRRSYQDALDALADYELIEHQVELDHYVIRVPAGETENSVSASLMALGVFEFASPDWMVYPLGCPNDNRFGNQWHHDNSHLDSCLGWDLQTGHAGSVVAICDTGIRVGHEDFQDHRQEGYNAVDRVWESNGGNIGNVHPHGTQCTGCAAANGNNGVGVSGIGWDLGHRMMRVSNSSGGGAYISDLTHAALTAAQAGDNVASVSYSGVNDGSIRSTGTTLKNSYNALLVWAAGNDGANLNWGDRDNDDVIVVGATDINDQITSWSARGRSMDVVAPGESVYTTSDGSNSDYTWVSGTSFACPLTAGLCALIYAADPLLTAQEVEDILKASCEDLGSNGIDDTYGHGRINVNNAMLLADGGGVTPPTAGFLFSVKVDDAIDGVSADDADILAHDTNNNTTYKLVDFSDVNSTNADIDAFCLMPDGSFLISFLATEDIDGLTGGPNGITVHDEDLVRFTPGDLGEDTTGSWSFYFDGSDVGLDAQQEDIDGVSYDAANDVLHISLQGPWDLGGGFTGKDEDILEFDATSLGSNTAGSWAMLLDGNDDDIKLGSGSEDIDGYSYVNGNLYMTTIGDFRVPFNQRGQDNDILRLIPTQLGVDPAGTFSILFDGATLNATMDLDGLHWIN